MMEKRYQTFWSFYPYYLTEHKKKLKQAEQAVEINNKNQESNE